MKQLVRYIAALSAIVAATFSASSVARPLGPDKPADAPDIINEANSANYSAYQKPPLIDDKRARENGE